MFSKLKLHSSVILLFFGFAALGLFFSFDFYGELRQIQSAESALNTSGRIFSYYDSLRTALDAPPTNLIKISSRLAGHLPNSPALAPIGDHRSRKALSHSAAFYRTLNRIHFSLADCFNGPSFPSDLDRPFLNLLSLNDMTFNALALTEKLHDQPEFSPKNIFIYRTNIANKARLLSPFLHSETWQKFRTALSKPEEQWNAFHAGLIYSLSKQLFYEQWNMAKSIRQQAQNRIILFRILPVWLIGFLLAFAFLALFREQMSVTSSKAENAQNGQSDDINQGGILRHQKTHRQILVQSERLFAELWDNSPDSMLLLNNQGEILAVNEAYCALVRLKREELIGKPFTIVYDDSERPELQEQFELCLSGNSIAPLHEAEYKMWFGQKLWLEFSHSSFQLPDIGSAVLSIIKDITSRKKMLLDLADSEKRFRTLFNNANDPAFVNHLTPDNRFDHFIEVNQIACETYLYSKEEFKRLTPLVLIPPEYRKKERKALETLLKTGHVIYEVEHFRKDKRRIPVEISAHLFEYKNKPTVFSIVRDISERKRAQKALQLSHEQLRNLASRLHDIREEERSMIAREIHDELGQLLTVLKIEISLLCKRFTQNDQDIRQKVDTISGLINQAVESVQQISSKLRPGILDEVGLVAALEWQAQEFSKHTGIQCRYSLTEEDIQLDKDKSTALFRIFQEALTNVARHSNAKRVSIFLKKTSNRVILEITDNGCGIKRQQIDSPRSLGILGMRERALVFGGSVSIRGVQGKGTHVKVEMPLG